MSIFENASGVSVPHGTFSIVYGNQTNNATKHDATLDYRPIAIANWLSSLNFRERLADFLEKRTEGTGEWLLKSQPFRDWLAGESRILWCSGIPGAGKSFLAAIAVDHLQRLFKGEDVAVACIFCNYKERFTRSLEELVASILKQMIQDQPLASGCIKAFYKKFRENERRPRLTDLIVALRSEIQAYSKVFFVIDALDECLDDYQGRLIAEFESISTTVYLMVTSRPLDLIKQQFQGACHLDINAEHGDVRKYIDDRIRRGETKNEILLAQMVQKNLGLRGSIMEKIVTNTRGMFLMAKLHIDSLVCQRSALDVQNALTNLPTKVNATYDEAMKRIQSQNAVDRKLAERVLSWITYARRPLSYQELQHALAVTPQRTDMVTEALVDKGFLIDICAGLVVVDDLSHIIRLAHYTTQEYFSDKRESLFPDAQADMTLTCLRYLSFHAHNDDVTVRWYSHLRKYPFILYAGVHWGHHACSNEDTTLDIVQKFLTRKQNVAYAIQILLQDMHVAWWRTPRTAFGEIHLLSFFGLGRTLSQLLKMNHSADSKDSEGQTPLSHAATQGHVEVTRLLLARDDIDVNSEDRDGRSPLSYAAEKGHSEVTMLLLARDDIEVNSEDFDDQSPLSYAAKNGHLEVTKLLLTRDNINVNWRDSDGRSLISYAAERGYSEVTKVLLGRDYIDVNSKDTHYQCSPLSYAVENGHLEVVKVLLARDDMDVNSKDIYYRSPLSYAAGNGNLDMTKVLLARDDIEVNSQAKYGQSPLSYAAEHGHLEVTKVLLARDDIEVHLPDLYNCSPLLYATERGHLEVANLLWARDNINVNPKGHRSHLSFGGQSEVVQLFMKRTTMGPSSPNDIAVSLASMSSSYPESADHNMVRVKRKQSSDQTFINIEKRLKKQC